MPLRVASTEGFAPRATLERELEGGMGHQLA
jgi:hypothetical protein